MKYEDEVKSKRKVVIKVLAYIIVTVFLLSLLVPYMNLGF